MFDVRRSNFISIPHFGIDVRAVNGTVAASRPARSLSQQCGVRDFANVNFTARNARTLHLRVAFQTKVGIAFNEHFAVDRTVRIMTNDAAFTHGFMFKNKWPDLFAMTLRAILVLTRHGQSA